jgi:hypothetical protein
MFALLLAASLYGISMSPKEKLIQELQAARTNANLSRMIEPENICFTLDNKTIEKYPTLAPAIKDANSWAEDNIRHNNHYGNYYTGTIVSLDRSQMLSMLRTYNFNQTVMANDPAIDKFLTYQDRNFNCGFSYSDKYYLLTFFFRTLEKVNTEHGYVPVHITQNLVERAKYPVTNVTIYGPFNNTLIFFNDLSSPVTIDLSSEDGGVRDTITLLPNKIQDAHLSPNWTKNANKAYHYTVRQYPWIEGDISVSLRYGSGCMSEEEAKSLYAQSDLQVRFPSYLPKGFRLGCIAENTGSYLIQIYVNQTAIDRYEGKGVMRSKGNPFPYYINGGMPEEEVKGIMQIHAQKYYIESENPRKQAYSAYLSILNNTANDYRTNPKFFDTGKDANSTSYLTFTEGRYLSTADVLTANEGYRVVGALPMDETMKIAKSLSAESGEQLRMQQPNPTLLKN